MITLKCGCEISEEGLFTVSEQCKNCKECNLISKLHPFGEERLKQ